MAEVTDAVISWFCGGENSSTVDDVSIILHPPGNWASNTCTIDLVLLILHLVFCMMASLVLIFIPVCSISRATDHAYIIRYPGHVVRWLTYILYTLLCIGMIVESILTSNDHHFDSPPRLYIVPLAGFLAAIFVMVYHHYMEYWELPGMWPVQFLYWVCLLVAECFRASAFHHDNITSRHMIWTFNKSMVAIDAAMCVVEIYFLMKKGFSLGSSPKEHPPELRNLKYLHDDCSLPSSLLYAWMNDLFKKGMTQAIEDEDMGSLPDEHSAKYSSERFAKILIQEQERARKKGLEFSFSRALYRFLKKGMYISGILMFVGVTSGFATPFLIAGVIRWVTLQSKDTEETGPTNHMLESYITVGDFFSNGYVLVTVLFFQLVFQKITHELGYHYIILEAAKVRAAIQSAVYAKSLRLSSSVIGSGSLTIGEITNHMSVDPRAIFLALQWFHSCWFIPYQVVIYIIILYNELGVSALVSCLILLLAIPVQIYIANKQSFYQQEAMQMSDERLKQTNEVLQGMKVVKLNAWERIFQQAIEVTRIKEVGKLKALMFWQVQLNSLANAVPLLVMPIALSLYSVFTGKNLTPDVAFTSLAVINQLQLPLQLLPKVSSSFVTAVVSIRRLGNFFKAPEIEGNLLKGGEMDEDNDDKEKKKKATTSSALIQKLKRGYDKKYGSIPYSTLSNNHNESQTQAISMTNMNGETVPPGIALKITNGSFSWSSETRTPIISDVTIDIPAGRLTMIVGKIGAGKSSLLSAMLGEMITLDGVVEHHSKEIGVAYAAQTAWLINASLKDNIVFGNPFSQKRYQTILEACCLQPDFDILPMGDQTEIGEQGINMSGGQKQRISVARAMYSSNDVVLLDDPLSALDVHVGSHMFFKGILDFLIEERRTVVLVTHQVQYLEHADQVIFLQNGCVARKGTMREIGKLDPSLVESWNLSLKAANEAELEVGYCSSTDEEREVLKKQISTIKKDQRPQNDDSSSKLIESEERNRGSVSYRYYWYYLCQFGLCPGFFVCFFAILQNVAQAGTQFWLSVWSSAGAKLPSNATDEESNALLMRYIGVYCALNAADMVLCMVWTMILLFQCVQTSKNLHNLMLTRVLRAPMRFFDTTPIGRIMNRFASDMQKLDQTQGPFILGLFKFFLATMTGVIINAIISWYFIVAIIPISLAYMLIMKVFIDSSREMQRLVNISSSPVFSQFTESLGGLATIRAYRLQKRFRQNIVGKIEKNHVAFCFLQDSNRWLGIRLNLIGTLIVLGAGLTSLPASTLHPATFGASLVGLAITYAVQAANSMTWVVRNSTSVELGMNSVERIKYYTKVENEKYEGSVTPSRNWPEMGHVIYNRVHARYAATLPAILHYVSIDFKPGMKVGICGRTGSGKSSLTLTLFRIIDTFKGSIHIDGIDIGKLSLVDLRSRLAIIPQDPFMFTGTVRFNLDPEERRSDAEIWEALEVAQLKELVRDLPNNLDSMVHEGGDNFSVGERQLFCLARAILKKTRILIMDEATASIDVHTDAILQEVVATAFHKETVITIAHRVSTILDSDQIVVLSEGHVAEVGTPGSLLKKKTSIFASLVRNKL
ncbi:ATP-binding cassette sub-family C member 9 isoform X1 [Strongylocentrotus purpuratus]|uniref:Uncharacterized protein n=1 Tax=Strongylocentrotus purpuratus TaxID=7668 RepID=A0A7M7T5V6_STRPU|nr:ATP-binding cassette sub-family C member 9 isoform X1 [Strongylocentrotus purpuratus]XP_030856171.1 ATP-binding cassette sub-family C member 9 isoform X1 [Strongylocentrotus purpuratus]XP_030856172.1 ATP-binding cassette sub-family C member 9 isoform X1 [Strongylocentrotus purpuratus]